MDKPNCSMPIDLKQPYLELAIESWRFEKLFARITTKMDLLDAQALGTKNSQCQP